MAIENETLLGVVIQDGRLMQRVLRGSEEVLEPVPERDTADSFADTETRPAPWVPLAESGSEPPSTTMLTHRQHEQRSIQLEALLTKALGVGADGSPSVTDTRGNTALAELLREMCQIMGRADWAEQVR